MTGYRVSTTPTSDPRYPLWAAYLHCFDTVAHLYDHSPHDPASYGHRLEELRQRFEGDREALAAVLAAYARSLGAPAPVLAAAGDLADPGSVVVIGGQQPGVLTGPLYTFWKAAVVIELAGEVRRLLPAGTKVVPVFWVGAEDHDLAEISQVHVLTPRGDIVRHAYDPGGGFAPRTSVGSLPTGPAVEAFLAEVETSLWSTEFTAGVVGLLRETAAASTDLGEWFGRLLFALFGDRGLLVANPLDPGLRALQRPAFRRMVEENEALAEAFALGQRRVRDLGFEPQVDKDPQSANLYVYRGMERVPLRRLSADVFELGPGHGQDRAETLTRRDLLEMVAASPERLSPNVVLRPVGQDMLLPVLAYVGGPGETSYFGLYREVYHRLGRRMPIVYPRPGVTIIERSVARHLGRLGLDPAAALDPEALQAARASWLDRADPVGIDKAFGRLARLIADEYETLTGVVAGVETSLKGLAAKNRGKVLAEAEWLRKKVWQEHRRKSRETLRRFDVVAASLRPRGDYQERVFNIFPYLVKYGPGLADALAGLPLVPPGAAVDPGHRLVWL
ncbi:MAG: bacillithiol biosynthesis cysteine-adding enzyme BshC [Bacillota bacterium]